MFTDYISHGGILGLGLFLQGFPFLLDFDSFLPRSDGILHQFQDPE